MGISERISGMVDKRNKVPRANKNSTLPFLERSSEIDLSNSIIPVPDMTVFGQRMSGRKLQLVLKP